jgi:hypothetical protein
MVATLEKEVKALKQDCMLLETNNQVLQQHKERSDALLAVYSENLSRLTARVNALETQ